ncbi:Holliday junction resolvase RuvX [Lactococcus formosensis]|jgi:RNAse H-fold protein YqgF|uniref:Putative pre-16S rRNA nuclease n=1 Tax=Lactococcus formosensis TaxID=1281486 RepID=A0A9Q8Y1T5_9LACT|nr:Holliday junction resolvase RuvX [Lactococcus formosensis]NHI67174.1 Holliday junction resolvase RuvX [Lactococcus garvieae]MCH1722583.1 Holliday junction resolvase RuvX [Lactococcus formosensis]MCO7179971.1 Holliday junction resolvase RuvX [Lactococcus formosensis]MDG6111665.1 Holliday junction resolvase RuvX [Lactococcus formosensis]MDG6113216.1 Holliday junction resolvase RuvX [Lactococcus formosensis]
MYSRILGLDVGTKTVGVAVSDLLGMTAQPVETIKIDSEAGALGFERLAELITEYKPSKIVLGLPKHMNNDEGIRAEASRNYGEKITETFDVTVEYQDERLTTMQAEKVLIDGGVRRKDRKKSIDKLAAVLILQNYLDAHKLF